MISICLFSVSKMIRPISIANSTKQVSSELFAVFKTGLSLNSDTLYLGTDSKLRSKGADGMWALREGGPGTTALINKCLWKKSGLSMNSITGLHHSLQCSHGLFLQMQSDSSIYTNFQSNALKYSETQESQAFPIIEGNTWKSFL